MILHRLSHLLARFGGTDAARRAAGEHAALWRRVAAQFPAIRQDLITQGGLLTGQDVVMQDGLPTPAPLDPYRLAYQAGRRDLALQLLSAASLDTDTLNHLITEQDYEHHSATADRETRVEYR